MKTKAFVSAEVKKWSKWWIGQRRMKLEEQLNDTMSVNPFLMPFLFDYHNLKNLDDLAGLMIASHLMTGHATGFGKLIDEKILPNVFGTSKLDPAFRRSHKPFQKSCFDEVDHLVIRENGTKELLSLKAGRWTIQLTMAVQLNAAFNEITKDHSTVASKIVVGVFYGKKEGLTDKYDILRGINRGANHSVVDLTNKVDVYAGRQFWAWLNDGQQATQEWVLAGFIEALKEEKIHETATALLDKYKKSVMNKYEAEKNSDGTMDWEKILKKING